MLRTTTGLKSKEITNVHLNMVGELTTLKNATEKSASR